MTKRSLTTYLAGTRLFSFRDPFHSAVSPCPKTLLLPSRGETVCPTPTEISVISCFQPSAKDMKPSLCHRRWGNANNLLKWLSSTQTALSECGGISDILQYLMGLRCCHKQQLVTATNAWFLSAQLTPPTVSVGMHHFVEGRVYNIHDARDFGSSTVIMILRPARRVSLNDPLFFEHVSS
jgi:hypothetical protein